MSDPRPTTHLRSPRAWFTAVFVALLALTASACASTATVTVFADSEQASAPLDDLAANDEAAAGESSAAAETGTADLDEAAAKSPEADNTGVGSDAATTDDGADRSATSNNAVAFAATPTFLAYAAEQVEAADSYRFEMFQEIDGGLLDMGSRNTPLIAGATSGTTARIDMDLGTMMGGMAMLGLGAEGDLTMNMIVDGETMYLNAPFFATFAELDPSMSAALPWLDTVASGWGSIDLAVLGGDDAVDALGDSFGMGAGDATELLSVLSSVGEVLDGGSSEVRGVPTRVAYATVAIQDLMAASGSTADDLGLPAGAFDQALPISVEVHVDDANRVRRLEYFMDLGTLLSAEESMRGMDMSMWQRIDFIDFGEDVDIAVPVGVPDITNDFAQLLEFGG